MPAEVFGESYEFLPREAILTFEEIERVARVTTQLGVNKVRITGGEPLLRREIETLIGTLAAIPEVDDLTLTTNGVLLADKASRLDIIVSDECDQLLDTGGGVRKALPLLGAEPFYVVNSDVMWRDGVRNSFDLLADRWCADTMDALLLLAPATMAVGYHGQGDFLMEPDGLLARRREREQAPFIFSGVQILHPRLLVDCPNGPFSLNLVWSRAIERGRLYGVRREGVWFHVGSPDAVKAAELWLPG